MDIEELSKKMDKYHAEDKNNRWMNLGLVSGGFAIATLNNYRTNPELINAIYPAVFLILGVISYLIGACPRKRIK